MKASGRQTQGNAKRKSLVTTIAAAATLVLTTAACGSSAGGSGSGSNQGGGSGNDAAATAKAALLKQSQPLTSIANAGKPFDAKKLAGKTVYYVPLVGKADYFQTVGNLLEKILPLAGVHVRICDGEANPSGIATCLNQAIARHAGAVITDYIPYNLAPTAFSSVVKAGIPLYVSGESAPANVQTTAKLRFDNPDTYQFATMRGIFNAAIADSGGTGHILFINTEDDPAVKRAGLYAEQYAKTACPKCTVVTKRASISAIQNVPSLVSGALIKDSQIKYVIPQYDSYLAPAIQGVQSAGKTRTIKLASANASLANLPSVKSNPQVIAAVGHDTAYSAWSAADAALRLMAGVPAATYPTPVRAFIKDNINGLVLTTSGEAAGKWFGDAAAYQDSFKKLWGLS